MGHDRYPTGDLLSPSWFMVEPRGLLSKDTPITSMGSCFARHVGLWLSANGYRFLRPSRGRWDRMYSSFSIRQEVERAYGEFDPAEAFWTGKKLRDPYRQGITWNDEEEARTTLGLYATECRRIFDETDVLILTVGVNEVWFNREDGAVFFQKPPYQEYHHGFMQARVSDNLSNLERIRELFSGQIIVSVSPIPLLQTFAPGNVIENSIESKATLLLAVKAFARKHEDVHYFPSYEIVMTTVDPFIEDNRHVKPSVVARVMGVFQNNYGVAA